MGRRLREASRSTDVIDVGLRRTCAGKLMTNAPMVLPFGTYLNLLVLLVDLHNRTSASKHV